MPIPSGNWKGNFNGIEGPLRIDPPNANGQVTGEFSGAEFRGFWDEVAQRLTFPVTVIFEGGKPVFGLFTAHLFRTPTAANPGQEVVASLSGHFEVTPSTAAALPFVATGTARRHTFGWFAQITEVT